jgi:hypothetical protein
MYGYFRAPALCITHSSRYLMDFGKNQTSPFFMTTL